MEQKLIWCIEIIDDLIRTAKTSEEVKGLQLIRNIISEMVEDNEQLN